MGGVYLVVMIGISILAYAGIVSQGSRSVAVVQGELRGFYDLVRSMLEIAVILVGPIIVGTSIQGEISRKSLDLVSSSPASHKYYLVGKVISGFRMILMMIFLTLPISAAAVVLGGATWGEVLITYWLLALHGLLCIAITLPIAVMGRKAVQVVFLSYLVCLAWTVIGVLVGFSSRFGMGSGEASPASMLFPFAVQGNLTGVTDLVGLVLPNWVIASAIAALVTKFFILAAGSAMSRYGSKETTSLRIHALLFQTAIAWTFANGVSRGIVPGAVTLSWDMMLATFGLFIAVPFLSCWSTFEDRKYRAEKLFDPRKILTAAPEGGLPYLLILLAAVGAVFLRDAFSLASAGTSSNAPVYAWLVSFWIFYWSVGWICSAFNRREVGFARRAQFALTFLAALVPIPVLIYLENVTGAKYLLFHPLLTLFDSGATEYFHWFHAGFLIAFAAVLTLIGEYKRRSDVLLKRRVTDGVPS